ncbi:hypothetical protein PGN61_21050 [Klebsiella aerogenes]
MSNDNKRFKEMVERATKRDPYNKPPVTDEALEEYMTICKLWNDE